MIKYVQTFAFILLTLFLGFNSMDAQEKEVKSKLENALHNQNSTGRIFYVAFPMNDCENCPQQALDIYVTASVNTTVTLTNEALGIEIVKNVDAFDITAFASDKGETSYAWEIKDSERPTNLAFKLESPDPLAVYCMNSKQVSSEGYLAIPVKYWGTEYIHNSFYDFDEVREWAGGFVVMAAEDNTEVNIQLVDGASKTAGFGKTKGGREHGDFIRVSLQKGQAYKVEGEGITRGIFDLSGSKISSNKPIGLLSYHTRTMIPATIVSSGRDHIIEMMPPVQAWGTEYITVELNRGQNYGDFFRVVAAEPQTTVTVDWWEKEGGGSNEKIGSTDFTLQESGDWWQYNHTGANAPHPARSIRGVSRFKADKPILVMQYSYSAYWDGAAGNYDPFMFLVTPVEQYTKETVFQTPSNTTSDNDFKNNFFNIVAIGDADDAAKNLELLGSVELDGKSVIDIEGSFVANNIPGTDLFWAFLTMPQGRHEIKGNTPFGGYIYGYAGFDSYGWPAATAFRKLSEIDTLAPIVEFPPGCYEWQVHNVDDPEHPRNGAEGDDPRQVDLGVEVFPELLEGSFNFNDPVYVDENGNELAEWEAVPPNYDFYYRISVDDVYQDALALLRVEDAAGNITDTTIVYEVDSLTIEPDPVDFGRVRLKNTKSIDVDITSNSDEIINILDIRLQDGSVFTISDGIDELPIELQPRETITVTVDYTPVNEYPFVEPDFKDIDSIEVETECLTWKWHMEGQGVEALIEVLDYTADPLKVGESITSEFNSQKYVTIRNHGTMDLEVTGLTYIQPRDGFALPNVDPGNINVDEITFANPFTIPGRVMGEQYKEFQFGHEENAEYMIEFTPSAARDHETRVVYHSNAAPSSPTFTSDSLSIWRGTARASGPFLESYDFTQWRVDQPSDIVYIKMTNELPNGITDPSKGTPFTVNVNNVVKADPTQPFEIVRNAGFRAYDRNDNVTNNNVQTLVVRPTGDVGAVALGVPVRFTPTARGDFRVDINATTNDDQTATGSLQGQGYIPEIEVSNIVFNGPILPGVTHPDTEIIEISNSSTVVPYEVVISDITTDGNAPNEDDFSQPTLVQASADAIGWDGTFPLTLQPGESVQYEFNFNPDAGEVAGVKTSRLLVTNDGGPWDTDNDSEPVEINNLGPDAGDYVDFTDGGYMTGEVVTTGVNATPIDYGLNPLCENPVQTSRVTNNSSQDFGVLTIEDIVPTDVGNPDYDYNAFTIVDKQIGQTVNPEGGFVDIEVMFDAANIGNYEAEYTIVFEETDENGTQYTTDFIVIGEFRADYIQFTLPDYTFANGDDVLPGDKTGENGVKNYSIRADQEANGGWESARVSTIEIVMEYNKDWMRAAREDNVIAIDPGNITNGWEVSNAIENTNGDITTLSFTLSSNDQDVYIQNDGIIATPKFIFLLDDTTDFRPYIRSVDFGGRNECTFMIPDTGLVQSRFCVNDIRPILVEFAPGNQALVEPVSPNPITTNNINVNYMIPTSANAEFTITDINGNVVSVPFSGRLNAGQYETTMNVAELPAGSYFLNFKYLGVEETQKLLIVR